MSWLKNDLADMKDGGGLRLSTITHFVCYGVLLFAVVFIAKQYVNEAVGRARAEAISETTTKLQNQADKSIAQRNDQATDEKKQIVIERQSAHSDAELIAYLNAMAARNAPLEPAPTVDTLIDAPSAVLNHKQLEGLADYDAKCRECAVEVDRLTGNLRDTETKLGLEQQKSKAWEQAAKGGTKLHKLGKAMKVIGCAAGGGALGSLARQSSSGAALGAASGAAVCSLF